ncbi:hypothetical protein [Streptomyces lydicus]|uniref:hypothetical protein n=1 Tax=Streptomyces lydicus TaxID=47763 RepID=UPI0019D71C6F|nr:hypothetical protein [Streptomyces lydicus]
MLLYADHEVRTTSYDEVAQAARSRAHGQLTVRVIVAPGLRTDGLPLPVVRDGRDPFRQVYGAHGGEAFLSRPDGYLGLRPPGRAVRSCRRSRR